MGSPALANKKNYVTMFLSFMQKSFKTCIRYMHKKMKRKIRRRFKLHRAWKPFSYSITEDKPLVTKRPYKFRSALRKLKKCLVFFYGLRKTRSSLRKMFIHSRYRTQRKTLRKLKLI